VRTAAARSLGTVSRAAERSIAVRAVPQCPGSKASKTASRLQEESVKWKSRRDPRGKIGDERVRTRFAWLPVEADDGFTYWLSTVVVREKLLPKVSRGGFEDDDEKWEVVEAKPVRGDRKGKK